MKECEGDTRNLLCPNRHCLIIFGSYVNKFLMWLISWNNERFPEFCLTSPISACYLYNRAGRLTDGPYTSYDLNTLLKATAGQRRAVLIGKGIQSWFLQVEIYNLIWIIHKSQLNEGPFLYLDLEIICRNKSSGNLVTMTTCIVTLLNSILGRVLMHSDFSWSFSCPIGKWIWLLSHVENIVTLLVFSNLLPMKLSSHFSCTHVSIGVRVWGSGDKLVGEVSRLVVAEACIQALDIEFTEGETYEINSVKVHYD